MAAHEHQDINDNFGEKYGIRQKDYEYKYNEDGVLETIVVYDADGNVISHLEYEYKEQ